LSGPSSLAGGIILNDVSVFGGSMCDARVAAASGATRTDQVSALEVEAIELIACLLGVVYVFVDHECCTL
jgi:hypothetical protein